MSKCWRNLKGTLNSTSAKFNSWFIPKRQTDFLVQLHRPEMSTRGDYTIWLLRSFTTAKVLYYSEFIIYTISSQSVVQGSLKVWHPLGGGGRGCTNSKILLLRHHLSFHSHSECVWWSFPKATWCMISQQIECRSIYENLDVFY